MRDFGQGCATASFCDAVRLRVTGEHEDADGTAIEPFALHDNLMLAGGVIAFWWLRHR